MPQKTETFRVFLSSPSDVNHERQVAKTAIISASRMLSARGIRLEPWLWEEDTTSDFSGPAQEVISKQLGEYDFYIGLMGSTFGSPTARFGSGTEEEFSDAMTTYEGGQLKRVGFFFKEVTVDITKLTSTAINQIQKISEFRERTGKRGLYKNFPNDQRLTELVTEFLVRSFDNYIPPAGDDNKPNLKSTSVSTIHPTISGSFKRETLSYVDKEISGGNTELLLEDLWIDIDLKSVLLKKGGGISDKVYSVTSLLEDLRNSKSFHICGRDISGKTAACSRLFLALHAGGLIPVLLNGSEIKSNNKDRMINKIHASLSYQYDRVSQSEARSIDRKLIVPIIDDFDFSSLSAKNMLELLEFLRSEFLSITIVTSISFTFSILESATDVDILGHFSRIEIQELGQRKRYKLIENWYRATIEYQDEEGFRNKIENARGEINRILVTHIVPRTPLIVLILLQAIDSDQVSDLAKSGYVRYYKFLIDNTILRNLRIDEAELAYALLPQLAWNVYRSSNRELSSSEAESTIEKFAEKRALKKASLYSVLERLKIIGLFDKAGENYRFKHHYSFYFFLSDFISKNNSNEDVTVLLNTICQGSWSKEHAVILVFLSFHTNNSLIISSIIAQLRASYTGIEKFDFEGKYAASINRLIIEAPKQVVDRDNTAQRRDSRLDAQDRTDPASANSKEEADSQQPLGEMEGVFMGVEVLGHIMRNHYAHLDAEPKREMFEAASEAILRCAGNFINMLSDNIDFLMSYTRQATSLLEKGEDKDKLESLTRTLIFILAVGFLYHCSKKLSQAVGDENLEITYNQAVANDTSAAQSFLDVIIRLDCFQVFPIQNLSTIVSNLKNNHVAMAALQIGVSERLDMRPPTTHADFQKYCKIVGLEPVPRLLERQRLGSTADRMEKKS